MKLDIEKSWRSFFTTGYLYRVTSMSHFSKNDGHTCWTENYLFDDHYEDFLLVELPKKNISHLKPEIRLWLEQNLSWNSWKDEWPGRNAGILFKRKKDILMFKLTWGGR